MPYAIVLLICWGFIAFFSLVNVRYFGLLPLSFLIFFFSQGFYDFKVNLPQNIIREKYWLYILALLVMFGLFGLLTFLWLSNESAFWTLLFGNIFARGGSYILSYEDGKHLFKYGQFILSLLILANEIIANASSNLLETFGWIIASILLSFTVIYHGIWPYFSVEKDQYYSQLLLGLSLSIRCVFAIQEQTMYGFTFSLINITIALSLLNYALAYTFPAPPKKREISLRRVLAGERILQPEKPDPLLRWKDFIRDLKESPGFLHSCLEYLNLFLLLGILVSYILPLLGGTPFHQLRYWTGIALFTINAILLKKTQSFSIATRFAISLMLNFSLYISILLLGQSDGYSSTGITNATPRLILRNMACGLAVLYAKQPPLKKYLQKADLIFWTFSSLLAMLLNCYLLTQLSYPGQLLFSLIVLYLGIQGTISYYAFQVIKNYAPQETKIDNKTDPITDFKRD